MFINVNGTVWDKDDYDRELLLMKAFIQYTLTEALLPRGFDHDWYHHTLDLDIHVEFRHRDEHDTV
jgi:hypothetical protein